jgi:hypothetical protein
VSDWKPPPGHPIDLTQARALMAGDYGRVLLQTISRYVAPIFWSVEVGWLTRSTPELRIAGNGTVQFVLTPERLLAVTANHVLSGYLECRSEQRTHCQILILDFNPAERLVCASPEADIATFHITRQEIEQIEGSKTAIETWPPLAPSEGRGIMIAGYPGAERREPAPREVNFGLVGILGIAAGVGEGHVSYQLEPAEYLDPLGLGLPPENLQLGGLSGAPVLTLIEKPGIKLVHWRLGGVVTQGYSGWGIIRATQARLIQPNGMIGAPPI